jgi:hypothetical protein
MAARRRLAAQLLAVVVLGTVVALGPRPSLATEYRTDVETVPVELEAVAIPGPGGAESTSERLVGGDEDVDEFTMIGATYFSDAPNRGRVRVLTDGEWSEWTRLIVESDHGPDPGTGEENRPASDPIWFGDGEGYEVSLPADASGVRVHLVREHEEQVLEDGTEEAEGYTVPTVRPRSAWGAAPYRGTPDPANGLDKAVIHHTVNGNGYSASQVPSMLRSIQAYHQGARGWDDIGYNFVIDRFGTVWEGRARSLYEPIIGAHALNHNTRSVGVAYLGDGTSTPLSSNAVSRLGRFLGWKMTLHGARPTHGNIKGHRDVGQSSCPGSAIYSQLGTIRSRAIAQSPPRGPAFDVSNSHPLASRLRWALDANIVERRRDGTFKPGLPGNRGDFIFWLWRLAGRPPGVPHGFSDIPQNAYYRDAVRWGVKEDIVPDYPNGRFQAGRRMTREQHVLQLWRYANEPNVAVEHGYGDVPDGVASEQALDWADLYGLVNGAAFNRAHEVTRGEAVTYLFLLRSYNDVPRRHWAFGAVQWIRFHVIATGFPQHRFHPDEAVTAGQAARWRWKMMDRDGPEPDGDATPLTRGEAVLRLWQMAGSPATDHEHDYNDIPPELEDAIDWAHDFDLIGGFGDGGFHPDDTITRAQLTRMMFRLAGKPGAWAVDPPDTVRF